MATFSTAGNETFSEWIRRRQGEEGEEGKLKGLSSQGYTSRFRTCVLRIVNDWSIRSQQISYGHCGLGLLLHPAVA